MSSQFKFAVEVPHSIAPATYHDCHDGGGYSFDESTPRMILELLMGLKEDELFFGPEGDFDTICSYQNTLLVRFRTLGNAHTFKQHLGDIKPEETLEVLTNE